jgi:RNA polymerase sigma-70 factor, ECF subfamily
MWAITLQSLATGRTCAGRNKAATAHWSDAASLKSLTQKRAAVTLSLVSDDSPGVQRIPSSDEWRAWLAAHTAKLLLYARQQTRNAEDAEDVLQEAIVESWQNAHGQAPPLALVFATIRRRAIDFARSLDRRARREQTDSPEPWFEPDIEPRDTHRLLASAVKNLTPSYCEVVTLKVWGGLTFREIAETTGVPLNTVASRYRSALVELRGSLNEVRP